MIAYPRSEHQAVPPTVRLIGLGNAGVHLADRVVMSGSTHIQVIAANTDSQSLASSVANQKIALGPVATRGLGAGGDPELGYEAARESASEIRAAVEGAGIIFLCAGLGGGTASGAGPVIAEAAREAGAVLISIITSPFSFEGRRRSAQAVEALTAISHHSAAVIHFENDRMSELAAPRAGIEETFASSDQHLAACVTALVEMLHGGSPMPISLADLLAAVGGGTATALFGRGEATGDNRAHEAVERALKSPLLDRGRLISEARSVIANISGPASLSFSEVAAIMRELSKHTEDESRLFMGVSCSSDSSAPVRVTILGNYVLDGAAPVQRPVQRTPLVRRVEAPVVETPEPEEEIFASSPKPPGRLFADDPEDIAAPAPASRPVENPVARAVSKEKAAKPSPQKVKQETLQFEPVARGRFEKSEPTIVEGEDLDVPTFLRMRGKS
jgi:cell division protein FtsZ